MVKKVSFVLFIASYVELPHLVESLVAGVELSVDHWVTAHLAGDRPQVVIIRDRHLGGDECNSDMFNGLLLTLNTRPEGWQTQSLYWPSSPE